jgi:alpha-1,3-mannosyl-glycoprotein beta-1,2-N-acetylglucosaminyltransferase
MAINTAKSLPKTKLLVRALVLVGCFVLLSVIYLSFTSKTSSEVQNDYDTALKQLNDKADKIYSKIREFDASNYGKHSIPQSNVVPVAESGKLNTYGSNDVIPVLLFACERPEMSRTLDSLLKYRPNGNFPIIISQDLNHQAVAEVIRKYSDRGLAIHLRQPVTEKPVVEKGHEYLWVYYAIARHYRWAFTQVFDSLGYDQVIIVEDDMEFSPDFFDYFSSFLPLLREDETLLCVSSWNDNGKFGNASDVFYRSDFFPGLGWMMTKKLWLELKPKWPAAFWDDWLRIDEQRKGRACIRPEVSRTSNFGGEGASKGQFFEDHIASVQKNSEMIEYTGLDANRKELLPFTKSQREDQMVGKNIWNSFKNTQVDVRKYKKSEYDRVFLDQVYRYSTIIDALQLLTLLNSPDPHTSKLFVDSPNAIVPDDLKKPLKLELHPALYPNTAYYCGEYCLRRFTVIYKKTGVQGWDDFVKLAKEFKLMEDIRAGQARTAYLGIVCFKLPIKNPKDMVFISGKGAAETYTLNGRPESVVQVCIAPPENKSEKS